MVVDRALSAIIKTVVQKKSQAPALSPLSRHWKVISPNSILYETFNRQFQSNSHSMVYFLIILMRCIDEIHGRKAYYKKGTPDEKKVACFTMDDMVKPYRKKRQYINSVLSSNEINRAEFTNCKMAFSRVDRGIYVVNPLINWL